MFQKRFGWILVLAWMACFDCMASGVWQPAGLEGKSVVALGVTPTNNDLVLAAVSSEGIYRTQDAGETWKQVWDEADEVYVITFDRRNPRIVYVGLDGAVLRSTNGGFRFDRIAVVDEMRVQSIVLDQAAYKGVYLGTTQGVYKSLNQGDSW